MNQGLAASKVCAPVQVIAVSLVLGRKVVGIELSPERKLGVLLLCKLSLCPVALTPGSLHTTHSIKGSGSVATVSRLEFLFP